MLTLALLGLVTIAVYASVRTHGLLYEDAAWLLGAVPSRWFFAAQTRLGAGPSALHLGNLAVHLVNGGLVYALARRAGLARAALLAVCIFWLHPIQRVPVDLIAGRPDLLLTTGILIAVLAASRALRDPAAPAGGFLAIAVVALAVAFVVKASAIVGLGLVALTATILDDRARLMHALGWVGLAFGTVLITIWSPVQLTTFLQPSIYAVLAFAGRQAVVVWRLLALVVVPVGFSVDHDYAWVTFAMGLLALVGLSAAVRWCWGQRIARPVLAWAGLWIVIAIAPRLVSLGIYPGVGPDITEAQWYPAMPGVAIGAAALLKGLLA